MKHIYIYMNFDDHFPTQKCQHYCCYNSKWCSWNSIPNFRNLRNLRKWSHPGRLRPWLLPAPGAMMMVAKTNSLKWFWFYICGWALEVGQEIQKGTTMKRQMECKNEMMSGSSGLNGTSKRVEYLEIVSDKKTVCLGWYPCNIGNDLGKTCLNTYREDFL